MYNNMIVFFFELTIPNNIITCILSIEKIRNKAKEN